jgi:cytochrome b6-f complex iron-sulfur subunit
MPGRLEPEPLPRRDFIGLAAIWSAVLAFLAALVGALRLPMPAVFPESSARAKIGPPDLFPPGSTTHVPHLALWMRHDDGGLYAMSAICTHLGCVAARDRSGRIRCPCHGSVFEADGRVEAGPAPRRLTHLALLLAPDGQVVVDTRRPVGAGARLKV